jgi:cobalt-zinc-cadmium efflux system membrane fusion protein
MTSGSANLRLAAALLALLAGLLAPGCGTSGTTDSNAPAGAAPQRPQSLTLTAAAIAQSGIEVGPVVEETRVARVRAPGLVALDETRTARIGSLQEGQIIDTRAQVGDRVGARQVLALMHSHDVHDAWAGYGKAMAERRRLEKELVFATAAHERAARLYADKAVSLQDVQRAEVDRDAAKELVDGAMAEVRRSIEELEHLGIETPKADRASSQAAEQIPVRSPIAGVVLERLVTPGTTVTPGTPLFVVSDLSTLWVVAEIDESHLSRVRSGRAVEVTVAAYPDERFMGTISFVADTVNPTTRRITVRSTVPNSGGRLKPEMFATVWLGEGDPRRVLIVPQDAVQAIDGRATVFLAEGDGRFTPKTVEAGPAQEGKVEIASGLEAGQRIAVRGSFALKSEWLKPVAGGEN